LAGHLWEPSMALSSTIEHADIADRNTG